MSDDLTPAQRQSLARWEAIRDEVSADKRDEVQALIDATIEGWRTEPPVMACPDWCTGTPGHRWDGTRTDDPSVWERSHSARVGDEGVRVVRVEQARGSDVTWLPPFISVDYDGEELTGDQATALASNLHGAVEVLREVAGS